MDDKTVRILIQKPKDMRVAVRVSIQPKNSDTQEQVFQEIIRQGFPESKS